MRSDIPARGDRHKIAGWVNTRTMDPPGVRRRPSAPRRRRDRLMGDSCVMRRAATLRLGFVAALEARDAWEASGPLRGVLTSFEAGAPRSCVADVGQATQRRLTFPGLGLLVRRCPARRAT
jgi:hypothetical protein